LVNEHKNMILGQQSSEGFSLTEVLITLIFISIVMVPLFNLLHAIFQTEYWSDRRFEAVRLAQNSMEEIIALPFEDVKKKNNNNPKKSSGEQNKSDDFEITIDVQNSSPTTVGLPIEKNTKFDKDTDDLKMVTVTVMWKNKNSYIDSVRISRLFVKDTEKGKDKSKDEKPEKKPNENTNNKP